MNRGRIKHMLASLGLITSLLVLHASACVCANHTENEAVESETHSHSETVKRLDANIDAAVCDAGCVCSIEQSAQGRASNSSTKEFRANDNPTGPMHVPLEVEFVAITQPVSSPPEFVNDLSYSSALKSLLPARAPPRL